MDLKGLTSAVLRGCLDSLKGIRTIFYLDNELERRKQTNLSPAHSHSPIRRKPTGSKDPTPIRILPTAEHTSVKTNIFQCCFLNGAMFLCSILLFDYVFLRGVELIIRIIFEVSLANSVWFWIELILRITFQSIWVVPLFAVVKCVNNLYFQDIGQSAYKYSRGRSAASLGISKTVADFIFSTVVETLFLLQATLMTYIPIYYLGKFLYIIHLSLLYSLYAFEYKWSEMGWEIHNRLIYIEENWAYFIGFGVPLVLATQLSDNLFISGSIFSILFPIIIISAHEGSPVKTSSIPINIFAPVIAVSNKLFTFIGKTTTKTAPAPRRLITPRR